MRCGGEEGVEPVEAHALQEVWLLRRQRRLDSVRQLQEVQRAMVELLQLRNGPVVRQEAVDIALRLEAAGHQLSVAPDPKRVALGDMNGVLTVTNGSRLSAEDRQAIARERLMLLAIIGYCQEGHEPR